jgi:hypothetical protein
MSIVYSNVFCENYFLLRQRFIFAIFLLCERHVSMPEISLVHLFELGLMRIISVGSSRASPSPSPCIGEERVWGDISALLMHEKSRDVHLGGDRCRRVKPLQW